MEFTFPRYLHETRRIAGNLSGHRTAKWSMVIYALANHTAAVATASYTTAVPNGNCSTVIHKAAVIARVLVNTARDTAPARGMCKNVISH